MGEGGERSEPGEGSEFDACADPSPGSSLRSEPPSPTGGEGKAEFVALFPPSLARALSTQRQRLLVEHRLHRGAGGGRIEAMSHNQIAAILHDRVGVLHDLEPLEFVVVVQAMLAPTISNKFITRNG